MSQAAKLLQCSPDTVRAYERQGKLKALRTGKGYRQFSARDVAALVRERELSNEQNSPGAIARRIFQAFKEGLTNNEVVLRDGFPPELVKRLRLEYDTDCGRLPPPPPPVKAPPPLKNVEEVLVDEAKARALHDKELLADMDRARAARRKDRDR